MKIFSPCKELPSLLFFDSHANHFACIQDSPHVVKLFDNENKEVVPAFTLE
jgi:hypothetical protein